MSHLISHMKKLRIAHIITRMDRGGAPDIVRLLVERLDPQRFEVTLIYGMTREPSAATSRFLAMEGQKAHMVPSLRRAVNPFFDVPAFLALLRILKREGFDIVHTHTAKAGVLGRIAARWAGARAIVHSPHGHDFYGYFGPAGSQLVVRAERFAARYCDRIHVLTQLEKEEMFRRRICPEEVIRVITSGVSLDSAVVKQGADAALCVGFIGRLESVKGPDYFVDAAAAVAREFPNVKFLVAGDGSLRRTLEERSRTLGLYGKMGFTGWVEDIDAAFGRIDILVVPSRNEAVGRVILEAAARGIPSVATRVGGIPEVVRDRETGLLVAPRDVRGLAAGVLCLLKDEALRWKMGAEASAWVRREHSESKMIAEFERLYSELQT